MNYKHISAIERDKIAEMLNLGISQNKIAKELNRGKGTISYEINKNKEGERYYAIISEEKSKSRRANGRKKEKLKNNLELKNYVLTKLKEDRWTPEEISNRVKIDYPKNEKMRISHEAIYKYIYKQQNELYKYLVRSKKSRKKTRKKAIGSRIKDRTSIDLRPMAVNNREEFGHFEGDSVVGLDHKSAVHTTIERISRKYFVMKVENLTAEETIKVQIEILTKERAKSITMDNGLEFAEHLKLKDLQIQTYFADPYSSYQRGTNEHFNGIFRRFYKKGTDFSIILQSEIDEVVEKINNRPLKILGWKTPNEVYYELSEGVLLQS